MRRTDIERFMSKIQREEDHWMWNAYRDRQGYGNFKYQGRLVRAHRWAYEYFVGPIPEGLVIDHLCRVTSCVNPRHLEPVTNSENLRRSPLVSFQGHRSTGLCQNGHCLEEVGWIIDYKGSRRCKECLSEKNRRNHYKNVVPARRAHAAAACVTDVLCYPEEDRSAPKG